MIPWFYLRNNLWARSGRTALMVLSVAGGVAALVAVFQAVEATRDQLEAIRRASTSRPVVEIRQAERAVFSAGDLASLADLPGVRKMVPALSNWTTLYHKEQRVRVSALGVDLKQYHQAADFQIVAGQACERADEVCLEVGLARQFELKVDDRVRFMTRSSLRPVTKRIVGLIALQGSTALEQPGAIFLPLAEAQRLWRQGGNASVAYAVVDTARRRETLAAIQGGLPEGFHVRTPGASVELSAPTEAMVNQGLNAAAALSAVASFFLVINAFLMNVAERHQQFAVLRLVGATPEQVKASMYYEAMLLGLLATVVGVAAGAFGGVFVARSLSQVYGLRMPVVSVRWAPLVAGAVYGPAITLAAVWYPARKAWRTSPLAILKGPGAAKRGQAPRWLIYLGTLAGCASAAALGSVLAGAAPPGVVILGCALLLLAGLFLLLPLLPVGSSVIVFLLGVVFPAEALLARRQLLDNFIRTSITVAVLYVVTAVSLGVGNTLLSISHDMEAWFGQALSADYMVRVNLPLLDPSESEAAPADVEAELQSIPGVEAIDRVTFVSAKVDDQPAVLLVREFAKYDKAPFVLLSGQPAEVRRRLQQGDAVLGAVLAHRLGRPTPDAVTLEVRGQRKTIRVAGIAEEFAAGGLIIVMDRSAARSLLPSLPTHVFIIRAAPRQTESVGRQVEALAQERGLMFQSLASFRGLLRNLMEDVTNGLWLILILALAIASFGIVNTLTMNILEQTRALGLLRVVGMSRAQVLRMFLCQAILMNGLALLPGGLMGAVLAYIIAICFRQMFGHNVYFALHPNLFGGYLAIATLLVLAVALLPAVRTMRLKPLEAIHAE